MNGCGARDAAARDSLNSHSGWDLQTAPCERSASCVSVCERICRSTSTTEAFNGNGFYEGLEGYLTETDGVFYVADGTIDGAAVTSVHFGQVRLDELEAVGRAPAGGGAGSGAAELCSLLAEMARCSGPDHMTPNGAGANGDAPPPEPPTPPQTTRRPPPPTVQVSA